MNVWLEVREFIVYIHMHTDFLTITLNANFPLLMPRLVQECHSELVAPVWRYSNLKKVQIREGSRVFYNSMSLVMTSGHGSKTSRLAFARREQTRVKKKERNVVLFYQSYWYQLFVFLFFGYFFNFMRYVVWSINFFLFYFQFYHLLFLTGKT